jgi:lysophospholipid hydrolase
LQTRRLIAGDSISLDQDKSFYCVVDGMVHVFAQMGQNTECQKGSWDEEDMNGYQLLNEVGSGGTLSSLFTILSLFTEDVKMSWQDGEPSEEFYEAADDLDSLPTSNRPRTDSDVSHLNIDPSSPKNHNRRSSASSVSTIHAEKKLSSLPVREHASKSPSLWLPSVHPGDSSQPTRAHHGIVARATEDTTLAVIPAEAFRRLTKNFPKATGHIVQGLLIFQLTSKRFQHFDCSHLDKIF